MGELGHLGINAVFLQRGAGGLETYVTSLVPELLALRPGLRINLYVGPRGRDVIAEQPWSGDVRLRTLSVLGVPGLRAATEVLALGAIAARDGVELLHSTAMIGPLRTKVAHVVTIGDLIWLLDRGTIDRLTTSIWAALVPRVARRADRVLTFSEASRRDLVEHLPVSENRIDVVPLGPGSAPAAAVPEADLRNRFGLGDGRVVLSVSAKKPHKNLVRLVRAFAQVHRRFGAVLVIPGQPTRHEDDLRAEAKRLGIGDALCLPPYLGSTELEGFYRLAACFVFPSQREGFGLPVLEAMRRGVPVACANASSLPEVAGGAARYFDPASEEEIGAALAALLGDDALARQLAEAGRRRAALFDWRRTAEETLASYEKALAG